MAAGGAISSTVPCPTRRTGAAAAGGAFFQRHHAHPPNGQVSESVEEMDTALEAEACEFTEMDTAPEM